MLSWKLVVTKIIVKKQIVMCLILFVVNKIAANLLFWIEMVNSKVLVPKKDIIIFCNNIRM